MLVHYRLNKVVYTVQLQQWAKQRLHMQSITCYRNGAAFPKNFYREMALKNRPRDFHNGRQNQAIVKQICKQNAAKRLYLTETELNYNRFSQ